MRVRAVRRKTDASKSVKNRQDSGYSWNWWYGFSFVLGIFVAVVGYALVPTFQYNSTQPRVGAPTVRPAAPLWGQLEYTSIRLERPDETFPEVIPTPDPIFWVFPGLDENVVTQIITGSGVTPDQQRQLLDRSRWVATNGCWMLFPPTEVVRDLTLPTRKALYDVLRKHPANVFLQNPARIAVRDVDRWLVESGLPADKQQLIRQVVVPEGDTMVLYDIHLLEVVCPPAERKRFAKAIAQIPALLMSLRITPDSDIESLARYWGQGGRGTTMKPFLESLRNVTNGVSVSVSYFFPAFARMRLYTYPQERDLRLTKQQDCFWTAMNFFNETPDNRFANGQFIQSYLKTNYTEVKTNWTFGDILLLVRNGEAIHMCVYVADDVVFTKNGGDNLEPWVLMKRSEMLSFYTREAPVQTLGFRRRIDTLAKR